MAQLVWDATGDRKYETGTDHGVLYVQDTDGTYLPGVVWNGLTTVTESPSGAEATALYADNIKYLNLISAEEFAATIEAYTYPDEFAPCDGSAELEKGVNIGQQFRTGFGFSYRTIVGNDVQGDAYGYKLHIIYNCKATPSDKAYTTINDTPDAISFSWDVSTTPQEVPSTAGSNLRPTASVVIDSTKADPAMLAALEEKLYGTATEEATLPTIAEIIEIFTPTTPTP